MHDAVAAAPDREVEDLAAAVVHRDHVLAARLGPAHGAPEGSRQPRDEDVLGRPALGAEAAADVGRDHAHVRGLEAEDPGQLVAILVRRLGRQPGGEAAVVADGGDRGAWLERAGGQPLAHHRPGDDRLAVVEQPGVGAVLGRHAHTDVGAHVAEQQHLVARRGAWVGHHRQRFVVHHHELGGIHARGRPLGHHGRDDLPDEAHDVARQRRAVQALVDAEERRQRERPEVDVGGGEHLHARQRPRRVGIDAGDAGVRDLRAHERHRQLAGLAQAVDVATLAGQEPPVLQPPDALPDDVRHGAESRTSVRRCGAIISWRGRPTKPRSSSSTGARCGSPLPPRCCSPSEARRSSTSCATTRRWPSRSCARWAAARCSCSASPRAPAATRSSRSACRTARRNGCRRRPSRRSTARPRGRWSRPTSRTSPGRSTSPVWASTCGPIAPTTPTTPTSCGSTSTRSREPSFPEARAAAWELKALLDELGIAGFPKTTGNRGLHVYVRLQPRWDSYEVRAAAVAAARELERRRPDILTAAWWKEERGKRIFVDYNQNAPHKTVFGAWSVRARKGAQVSTPVRWEELDDVHPDELTRRERARAACSATAIRGRRSTTTPQSLEPLLALHERDRENGLLDAPWPPVYPKQPNEPPRVAPSRARREEPTEEER